MKYSPKELKKMKDERELEENDEPSWATMGLNDLGEPPRPKPWKMKVTLPPKPKQPTQKELQFIQSINQSLERQQKMIRQEFEYHLNQLRDDIEDCVTASEKIRALEAYSEKYQKELSGIIFIDPETREVEKVYLDQIGDTTSVDLDMVRISPDPDTLVYSFHTHPVYGNPQLSVADMEVIQKRTWEQGHCVLTEVNGEIVANCVEL